jgi:hypothetical protein
VSVDLRPAAVTFRIRAASAAADLHADRRLYAKIDLSPAAITRRLRAASQLRDLCLRLQRAGRRVRGTL